MAGKEPEAPSPDADERIGEDLLEEGMSPGSSLAHLYRGEIHRMKLWRERLDRTTNWAVISLAGILTWSFSNKSHPHYLLLIGMVALTVFLWVEARRYRGYDMWRSRVRDLQENVFAYGLDPDRSVDESWRERLSEDYREPRMKVSREEALAHRLLRIDLPMFLLLLLAWSIRVTAFSPVSWPAAAAIGTISGSVV
ncbi:MAG: DUF2270 domain-containing protein, partial [Candidatus Nanohaloarchaea archaeon]|nr:DUF2270 domain-containing protein [Candidatus Nanohaloarchaea archaeon]